MSVDFFWRRVAGKSLDELSPKELGVLVPHWFDAEFKPLREAGMVMSVERNGYLMHFALTAVGGTSDGVAQLPVSGVSNGPRARKTLSMGSSGRSCGCFAPTRCRTPRPF